MKDESIDPYGIGMKLGEISSNIVTIFKKLDSMEKRMADLEDCHTTTREELRKMQGMENGISQKKENRLKTISMHIAAIGLVSAIVSFLIDFFSSK
jgi:hypothetical protein